MTTTISDLKSSSLRTLGYTGSTNDMYRTYLQAISGSTLNSIDDLEKLVLGTGGSTAGRWKRHLDLHGIRGQSLPDMLYRYWSTIGASGLVIPYLFRAGEQGVWYDYSDFSTLFQDSAGTTPVTAVGQPVGRVLDKSGNGNHKTQPTSTARPTLQIDSNNKYYLSFDGIDDFLVTSNINFSATDEVNVFAGVYSPSNAAQTIAELSVVAGTNNGAWYARVGTSTGTAGNTYIFSSRGTAQSIASFTATFPDSAVLSYRGKISTDTALIRRNGVAGTPSVTDQGTANYGAAYPLYIGMRAGTTFPFQGRLYNLIVRDVISSTVQSTTTEVYVNSRTGAY